MIIPSPVLAGLAAPRRLLLSPSTVNVGDMVVTPTEAYAGIKFFSTGTEYRTVHAGSLYTTSRGPWLDQGQASKVWIKWTRTGGTLGDWNDDDAGDARLNFDGSDYAWRIVRPAVGTDTIIGNFTFWDAETDGNQLATTGNLTFTAEVDSGT